MVHEKVTQNKLEKKRKSKKKREATWNKNENGGRNDGKENIFGAVTKLKNGKGKKVIHKVTLQITKKLFKKIQEGAKRNFPIKDKDAVN